MDYLGLTKEEKDNLLDLEFVRQAIKEFEDELTKKGVK